MPLKIDSRRQGLLWHGSFFVHHSLALVNRELALSLLDTPAFAAQFDLGLDEYEPATFDPATDARFAPLAARRQRQPEEIAITLRHRWPPQFDAPPTGKLIVIQPWEFGSLPRAWVPQIARSVDEIWVPSRFVRETYINGGVPGDKVVVVPNGVNTARFHPDVAPFDFAANEATKHLRPETYKFLFVGGTIARKGIDVLLDAYERAFTAKDDVALIIKDFGTDTFYANQGAGTLIRALQAKPNAPQVVYMNDDLSEAEIASLYAACDCLAHPYRGEGYGLPIAEAMACGKPTVVTNYGAALDFANSDNAYLIEATVEQFSENRIGDIATVGAPFWANPSREALAATLRHIVTHRDEAQAKGARAQRDIAEGQTWKHAAAIALERITALAAQAASEAKSGAGSNVALPAGLGGLSLGSVGLGGLTLNSAPGLQLADDRYETRKQAALQACREGDWSRAVSDLETGLIERPDDWDAVNALGVAHFRSGAVEKALELLRRGVAEAPQPRDFHHNLAFILLADDRPEEALGHAIAALKTTPGQPELRRTVERAGEAALKKARQILRRYPDKQRAQAKRDPAYRRLMNAYQLALDALAEEIKPSETTMTLPAPTPAGVADGPSRLSLCMIVKNEERFLRNCLQSAKDVVDEIVIVDTGSTDSTLDIAREFGATIVEHAWNDDFSEARNVSLAHATGNWALWMDADEEIAPDCGPAFRKAIEDAPADLGGYMVKFHNWLSSAVRTPNGEMAVHHAVRLFRRVPGVRFEGRIHEQNLRSLQSLGYRHQMGEGLILDHFGYAGEIMTLRNKHERFIRMLKREVDECPDDGFRQFHLFNLGNAYFTAGDLENAAHFLGLAAQTANVAEEYTVTLFTEWASSLQRLNRAEEGLEVCEKADAMGIHHAGMEFTRGHCYLHMSEYVQAEQAFMEAIRLGQEDDSTFAATGDAGVGSYKALYGLALALVGQEYHEDALPSCDEALELQPTMIEARYLKAIILMHLKRNAEAIAELKTILQQDPKHEDAQNDLSQLLYQEKDYAGVLPLLRQRAQRRLSHRETQARLAECCEKLGLLEEARDAYERLRLLAPESVDICVNLARMLAATGADQDALDCYVEAIEMDPDNSNACFNAGDLLYKMGEYARAADAYGSGLQLEPQRPSGFFTLGNCYFQTRDYEAAVACYQQTLALEPDHAEARNNLELAREMQTLEPAA